MVGKTFSGEVNKWCAGERRRHREVLIRSVDELLTLANTPVSEGGNMPVLTGWLRGSLAIGINGEPRRVLRPRNPFAWRAALRRVKPGDVMYARWTAPHANRKEFGFFGTDALGRKYAQPGHGFMRQAQQMWPSIVRKHRQAYAERSGA